MAVVLLSQLWENAVHFWADLQHYHELFYQDGLDPYRVQREAQVSTYTHKIKTEVVLRKISLWSFLHSSFTDFS